MGNVGFTHSKETRMHWRLKSLAGAAVLATATLTLLPSTAHAQRGRSAGGDQPNILVIWGDDVGWSNINAYNRGMMGYKTPNLDRIAKEGMLFTDCYGQQSCTAARSAFITGQHPYRTGLLTVGQPGSPIGLQDEDPPIAELLKNQGYTTGHFG